MTTPKNLTDLSRLCIHTVTTKPWSIETAIEKYAQAGIGGISVWREALDGRKAASVRRHIEDAGLSVVSYVRGGFFSHLTPQERQSAIDENERMIHEAAELGAPHIVLVCGAHPQLSLDTSRKYIQDALEALIPVAAEAGVKLGIEPLHPMYAGERSAITSLSQANDMAEALASDRVGVVVDVYHVWWDERLDREIARCAANGHLYAFHVCDWRTPTRSMLNDREIMGKGCINVKHIHKTVSEQGFDGFTEVEIFSTAYWSTDQDNFLQEIIKGYLEHTVS